MNSPVEAVLFDLDGTLIDTAPDFVVVLNKMRLQYNLDPLPDQQIRQQVSNGAKALIRLSFGDEGQNPNFEPLLQQLLDEYLRHLAVESRLFDHLDGTLKNLEDKQIPWGIVTNKPSRFTNPLIQKLELAQRCAVAICPDQVTHSKPHPEPILKACEIIEVKPENTLYVGDHIRDIEAGKNANTRTVAAAWGYLNADEDPLSWQADVTLDTPLGFSRWLNDLIA